MKKSIVGMLLMAIMVAAVFVGCAPQTASEETGAPVQTVEATVEPTKDVTEPVVEETPAEDGEEPAAEPTNEQEAEDAAGPQAAPGDIQPVEASAETPAQVGEWVETKRYSPADSEYHTVYYRIVDIERGDAAQAVVDRYNDEDHVSYFAELEDPDLEFCLITYEVHFPENFPAGDLGITSTDIGFGAKNPDGGGITVNGRTYIGLGSGHDVSAEVPIETLYPGDTWTGEAVFAMAKDFSNYVIESYYFEDDEQVNSYVAGK